MMDINHGGGFADAGVFVPEVSLGHAVRCRVVAYPSCLPADARTIFNPTECGKA